MGIISVTRENFDQLTRGDKPLLLEFQAPWCTYCRRLQGAVEEIAQQYEGQLVVGAMNIDDEEALSDSLGIELVPTLMLFQNGQVLSHVVNPPSKAAIESFLNQELPAPQQEDEHLYDMVVIGGGPTGYTAALYGARAGLDTLVLEKLSAGGQMAQTTQIDNYPGFEEGVDGFTLGMKLQAGAQRFGAQTLIAEVQSVQLDAPVKVLHTSQGVIRSRTVVIATGADHRSLGLEGEEALTGRGVSYCAACDGMFFKGKRVAVVGGGNSAAADALTLTRLAKEVILIHRRDQLRATKVYHDPLQQADNLTFQWNSQVTQLLEQDGRLHGVTLRDVYTGEERTLEVDGLFVSIGRAPATQLFQGQVPMDKGGYLIADETTRTALPGVYAAGDVRTKPLRQIVTAVADGAAAVQVAEEYLMTQS